MDPCRSLYKSAALYLSFSSRKVLRKMGPAMSSSESCMSNANKELVAMQDGTDDDTLHGFGARP